MRLDMVYKEDNILFPLCAANFTMDEWKQIYRDSKDYAQCLGVVPAVWEEAETTEPNISKRKGEIVMPGGHLTVEQLTAMLNTLPLEISFVDESDINRYFNEGHKVFKHPSMAIDRSVFSCHPPKIEPMVRALISDFRAGKHDQVPVWMEKNGHTMLVSYMAVRELNGQYVGTMEIVQDMEFAKSTLQTNNNNGSTHIKNENSQPLFYARLTAFVLLLLHGNKTFPAHIPIIREARIGAYMSIPARTHHSHGCK